jgi:hypothetical protein
MDISLKPRLAALGLSLLSGIAGLRGRPGYEPSGKAPSWSVGHDRPPGGSWQVPARRTSHRRVGALLGQLADLGT